jgi:hypothetical protein
VRNLTDGRLAIGALIAFALWIFVALPLYYGPRGGDDDSAAQHCSAQEEKNYGFWEKTRCDPVAYFTAWLVGFTSILAISTIGLWGVTLWSSVRQSRDMRASIAVADRNAKAAELNAKTAELALLSVEVPYLYPFIRSHGINTRISERTGHSQIGELDFGNDFITYYFQNFGRTPAEIIEVNSIVLPSRGTPHPFQIPEHPFNSLSGHVVTAGGESMNFPCAFTKATLEIYSQGRFNAETYFLWFMGYVRYNDVFGNEYVRGFCLGFSPLTGKFYPSGGDGHNYRKKTKSAGEIPDSGQKPTV